jgi:cell division protein ZapA
VSNVSLDIGGRAYTVACAEGEEAHVAALGQMIDAKLRSLPTLAGQSEPRQLLFAALLLADELHEQQRPAAPAPTPAPAPAAPDPRLAETLEAFATRLERFAETLENDARDA